MAEIIEFYVPKSFVARSARIPSQPCGKVLPFRAGQTENTPTPVEPLPMLWLMFATESEQTGLLLEEIISPPPEISNCNP